jgi:hypothetical protein
MSVCLLALFHFAREHFENALDHFVNGVLVRTRIPKNLDYVPEAAHLLVFRRMSRIRWLERWSAWTDIVVGRVGVFSGFERLGW